MPRVALVWHGDRDTRDYVKLEDHRLGPTAEGLRKQGLTPEAAVYNDDFADEVREQVLQVDAALVWVNPIEQDRDRTKLDRMLKEVANEGVLVSAHPDTIQKMGTKEVLYETRHMGWGSDVHVYRSFEQLKSELPPRLTVGKARVLKQFRGHSGHGIWKVSPTDDPSTVKARHAARGSVEEQMPLEQFLKICEPFFAVEGGRVVEQEYQERLADGMIRCYHVKNKVEGFGHQAVNALFPPPDPSRPEEAPQPGPRLYYPATQPEFQAIKRKMENEWLPEMMAALNVSYDELPLLWDADFFFGPKDEHGEDTYVLCEINVSSVYPYPESAIEPLAKATKAALETHVRMPA